ncbi:DUF5710 domain-containing protein [Prauserella alba]|uniref:DUF5710 domain-containing protein n=1 Tax=Prauserella alba TaxID=176898 RepID=A0ABP4G4Y3_9PSEU|nr:DUF5710 domain-containing protein [Prauserella alba]MCP2182109.1 hypothetical protein [Prauserella alba]
MRAEPIWLDVPFGEKDAAKAAGARWDPEAKRWYAPRPGMVELEQWAAQPDVPTLLPGEDRSFGSGLFVDLVPSSCWFTNVRYCVAERDWERLRRMMLARANHRCEVCDRREDRRVKRWLEAHERWAYDNATTTQTLRRLIILCSDCHRTTHFGLAEVRGLDREAFDHLIAVTGMTVRQGQAHVDRAKETWRRRSARNWHLNLDMLTTAGITVAKPPDARKRRDVAAAELRESRQQPAAPSEGDRRRYETPGDVDSSTEVRRSWLGRLLRHR